MRSIMSLLSWKAGVAGIALVAATAYAVAQMADHQGMHGRMGQMATPGSGMPDPGSRMMGMMRGQSGMHGQMGGHSMMGQVLGAGGEPTSAGQGAFGAIQEIVRILEADPSTDWSKVSIGALRQHLIDMDEVTLRAAADERAIDSGLEISITGDGRTLEAIKRMIPVHAIELGGLGWSAKTEDLPNGVKLVVTSTDPKQVVKLRALGFMGIMVEGGHHQPHHLAMAKGEVHAH
jgi:hypothetical protein